MKLVVHQDSHLHHCPQYKLHCFQHNMVQNTENMKNSSSSSLFQLTHTNVSSLADLIVGPCQGYCDIPLLTHISEIIQRTAPTQSTLEQLAWCLFLGYISCLAYQCDSLYPVSVRVPCKLHCCKGREGRGRRLHTVQPRDHQFAGRNRSLVIVVKDRPLTWKRSSTRQAQQIAITACTYIPDR